MEGTGLLPQHYLTPAWGQGGGGEALLRAGWAEKSKLGMIMRRSLGTQVSDAESGDGEVGVGRAGGAGGCQTAERLC